ncbi:Uncharacterised protein [Vibrio cholerae]|nr:Uncharacterised protein [Vibrio cholerae]
MNFNHFAFFGHDHVHIRISSRIFDIFQIAQHIFT